MIAQKDCTKFDWNKFSNTNQERCSSNSILCLCKLLKKILSLPGGLCCYGCSTEIVERITSEAAPPGYLSQKPETNETTKLAAEIKLLYDITKI